jgi:hypothetical protein
VFKEVRGLLGLIEQQQGLEIIDLGLGHLLGFAQKFRMYSYLAAFFALIP